MQQIPWQAVGIGGAAAIATLFTVSWIVGRAIRYVWREAKPIVLGAYERWVKHLDRQEEAASKQYGVCGENVSLNTDTNHGVRSQNKAILEMLHGARIGLGQANLSEQPRRQIEERLGEAERIIREAG